MNVIERISDVVHTNLAGLGGGVAVLLGTTTATATGNAPQGIDPLLWALMTAASVPVGVAVGALFRVLRARRRGRIAARAAERIRRALEKERRGNAMLTDRDEKNDPIGHKLLDEASELRIAAGADESEVKAIDAEAAHERGGV